MREYLHDPACRVLMELLRQKTAEYHQKRRDLWETIKRDYPDIAAFILELKQHGMMNKPLDGELKLHKKEAKDE